MAILGCIWATFTQLKGEVAFIGGGIYWNKYSIPRQVI